MLRVSAIPLLLIVASCTATSPDSSLREFSKSQKYVPPPKTTGQEREQAAHAQAANTYLKNAKDALARLVKAPQGESSGSGDPKMLSDEAGNACIFINSAKSELLEIQDTPANRRICRSRVRTLGQCFQITRSCMEKLKSTSDPVASRSNGNSPVATKTASPGTPSLPDSSRRQAKFKGDDVDAALENMLRAAEKTRKSHDTDFLISEILKYALEAESIYAPEEKRKREAEEVQELTREWSTLQKSALTTCKELHGAVLIGDNKQSLLDDYLERAQVAVEDLKESNDLLVSLQSRDPGNAEWGRKHRRTDSLVRTITGRCDDLKAQALPSRPPQ